MQGQSTERTAARRNRLTPGGTVSAMTAIIAATFASSAKAEDAKRFETRVTPVQVEKIADGLQNPWSVEVLPDGAYIVSERPGRLRIIRDGKVSGPLKGLPDIAAGGQGGLLDVELDPDFATGRILYFTASIPGEGGRGTAVFSAKLADDEASLVDVKRLFAMNRFTDKTQHFGSRISIASDGTLFFGIGDRGDGPRAQDVQDHAGSIMRINRDGSIPGDNPFAAGGGLAEIWSIGHRNPQGMTIDPANGQLMTVEHGARGGDEINTPDPGKNYGWPVISFGSHYSGEGFPGGTASDGLEQPIYYWDPSIAPGALAVYGGDMFPEWKGDILVAALKYQLLARLDRDETGKVTSEERLFDGEYGRIRDVVVAPDGAILMVTDENNGALLRVSRPAS